MGKDDIGFFYEYASSDYPHSAVQSSADPACSTVTLLLPVLLLSSLHTPLQYLDISAVEMIVMAAMFVNAQSMYGKLYEYKYF